MSLDYPPEALYYLNQALLCLVYLAGIAAGVFLITRKRKLPGILAVIAFLLMGISLVVGLVAWEIIAPRISNIGAVAWASYCIATPLSLLGIIALVVMIFLLVGRTEKSPSPPEGGEPPVG